MPANILIILALLFFVTSIIGVVTGSNSLIAVPVMFEVGVDEKVAVATNMFGLVFMAVGGAIPFLRQGAVDVKRLSPMIVLTVVGSGIGAAIVGLITNEAIKVIVTVAMIAIVLFTVLRPSRGSRAGERENHPVAEAATPLLKPGGELNPATPPHTRREAKILTPRSSRKEGSFYLLAGFAVVFLLAIYGGLYSGGYVTVLTAALVAFFGMSFAESIAATKVINIFSSSVATLVFIYQGLVDFKLGIILGMTMFVGAFIGAHYASKMNEVWLRRIFLAAVLLLAVKAVFDLAF